MSQNEVKEEMISSKYSKKRLNIFEDTEMQAETSKDKQLSNRLRQYKTSKIKSKTK